MLSGCVTTVAGTAVRPLGAAPLDLPPLEESQLDDVMLSIGELNGIVGATQMKIVSEIDEMSDHSDEVSDPDCLGAVYGAEEAVYEGSGWTAMRDQVAREPSDDNDHWVEQTAVIYPSQDNAQKFFDESKSSWENCAGYTVGVGGDIEALWAIDEVTVEDNMITQTSIQQDVDGWGCQHALAFASNLTVEAWACSYSPGDEAATIASEMLAKAAKR
ncbi:MAG: sensor domain-containing protein [Actinobacteria bacterium]|nr:sensor domain-containing protein [Actinomycetota bacterium]